MTFRISSADLEGFEAYCLRNHTSKQGGILRLLRTAPGELPPAPKEKIVWSALDRKVCFRVTQKDIETFEAFRAEEGLCKEAAFLHLIRSAINQK